MNMRISLIALFALAFVGVTNGGTCPKYPILRDFDFQSYTGMWYQQDKLQSSWEAPGRCWKTLYMRDRKNGQFKMRIIFTSTLTGRVEQYDSQLTLRGPARPSLIKYTIPLTFMEDQFQVLATDYTTFAIEYKCDPNGILEKSESIFLLTRAKNPSPLVLQKAYAIMHRYGIDIRKLERVDQTCGGIDLVDTETASEYPDYDYQSQDYPSQTLGENRRKYDVWHYEDEGFMPMAVEVKEQGEPMTMQQQGMEEAKHFEQPEESRFQNRRRERPRRPLRRQANNDARITLGQSLATRLWQVLHTPI